MYKNVSGVCDADEGFYGHKCRINLSEFDCEISLHLSCVDA